MATVETLLTAEEFARLPDDGRPTELVRGKVFVLEVPTPKHGVLCSRVVQLIGTVVDQHDLGWVMCNGSAVVTEHDPDTVRGADVCYYSFERVPRGQFPEGYLSAVPELAVEVKSSSDCWSEIHTKVSEYLKAGVLVVCVVDPKTRTVTVYDADNPPRKLTAEEVWTVPQVLPGFEIPVARLFA